MRRLMAGQSHAGRVGYLAIACVLLALGTSDAYADKTGCRAAASASSIACKFAAKDDLFTDRAICMDSPDDDLGTCLDEARFEFNEVLEECREIASAQLDVCAVTEDAAHVPDFGADFAANFVDPRQIGISVEPNPWFPLVQGNQWTYEGSFEEDGEIVTETIVVTVLNETKLVDGITCLVVRDVVEVDGELLEDTDDWFAQDLDGNVWYCGEEVKDYEWFDGDEPPLPELVSDDGSFKAGRDGDKGGILLPKMPVVGDVFRQELSIGNAEDIMEIVATDGSEDAPAASCDATCLVTFDFSPLDPEAEENKYYAPDIGLILEVDLSTGDRVELIDFVTL